MGRLDNVASAAEAPVWWRRAARRAATVARVVALSLRAPRGAADSWDRYWSGVSATGDGGDVLWDASAPDEVLRYLGLLAEHADPHLPVVDVGCGNGRYTRALAARFTRVFGVDLSPAAVALAGAETTSDRVEYRSLDMTVPGVGAALHGELGEATVFVRGVLHVLDAPARRRLAANLAALVGARGVALVAETNHRGPLIGYLERLGAGPAGLPAPLARAVATGIPRPSAFGEAELDDCFPRDVWERLVVDADATITTVPLRASGGPEALPGFLAVLRPLAGSGRAGSRTDP